MPLRIQAIARLLKVLAICALYHCNTGEVTTETEQSPLGGTIALTDPDFSADRSHQQQTICRDIGPCGTTCGDFTYLADCPIKRARAPRGTCDLRATNFRATESSGDLLCARSGVVIIGDEYEAPFWSWRCNAPTPTGDYKDHPVPYVDSSTNTRWYGAYGCQLPASTDYSCPASSAADQASCRCEDGTDKNGTLVTKNCGETICGKDLITYECVSKKWISRGNPCN